MNSEAKILIVDDDRSNRQVLTDLLRPYAQISLAKNGIQALELIKTNRPSLILLDIMMPEMNGLDFLKHLQHQQYEFYIPVIVISAKNEVEDEEASFELGACDYITKPFQPSIVKARVKIQLEMLRQRMMLEKLANIDVLTAIPNKNSLDERLRSEWGSALRNLQAITLAVVDVDYFQDYNSSKGLESGDQALKLISQALKVQLRRPRDWICRYSGEEFVIILPETDEQGCIETLRACCDTVIDLQLKATSFDGTHIISVSIGASSCIPTLEDHATDLLLDANKYLNQAKMAGRNQVITGTYGQTKAKF